MTINYNAPFLLIETPRAGKWNYRHITPPDLWMNQQQILSIIEAARKKEEGKNFLAVGQNNQVKQSMTDRSAPELLILAGIDTRRLSSQEKQTLRDLLQSLLIDVDQLVTKNIDWDTEGENDPVARKELMFWFETYFKDTENLGWKSRNNQRLIAVSVIAAIIIGTTIVNSLPGKSKNPPNTSVVNKTKNILDEFFDICGTQDSERVKAENELLQIGLLKKQDGELELVDPDNNQISQIIGNQSSISASYIMPEERRKEMFENLFGQAEKPLSGLKDLISCRNKIREFTSQEPIYTPFMTKSEIDELEKKIDKHRQEKNEVFYKNENIIVSMGKNFSTVCGETQASSLKFINKCYEKLADKIKDEQLDKGLLAFWKKTGSLLDTCKKVIPPG